MEIYFDNAATTLPLAIDGMGFYANPSSPHGLGIEAERIVSFARQDIANALGVLPQEIIFTSGGTESNNMAILGFAFANQRKKVSFVACPWDHPSIIEPLNFVHSSGIGAVMFAQPNAQTCTAQGPQMAILSHVNSETGDVNDVTALAKEIKDANPNAIVMVDGIQSLCKEDINFAHIDAFTFSGHKCHSPAGIGGIIVRNNLRLMPLVYGGGQERGLRPGTENVSGISAMAKAISHLHAYQQSNYSHVTAIKNKLLELVTDLPGVTVNALTSTVSPYILNLSFAGTRGEVLVHSLSSRGVYAAMGSACKSRSKTKTALEIMGFSSDTASTAVRFSFSHLNTMDEAVAAKEIIMESVTQMRNVLGVVVT